MSGTTEERTVQPAQISVLPGDFCSISRQTSVILILATSFWACAGESSQRSESGVTVRDSAGITIVENHTPAWGADQGWRFAEEPDLTIGVLDGPAEYTFDAPRPFGLSDRRILVADFSTRDLRYFSPMGEHLKTVGGEGSGPGEFERLASVFVLPGDTVLAFDPSLARVTVFDESGDLVRVVTLERPAESIGMNFASPLENGSWLIGTESIVPDSSGIRRRWTEVGLFGPDGVRQAVLDTVTTRLQLTREVESPRVVLMVALWFAPLGRSTAGGDQVYVTDGDEFEVRVYGSDGHIERIIRLDTTQQPITEDDIDAYMTRLEEQFERFDTQTDFREAFLKLNEEAVRRSRMRPAIRDMIVDPSGHLLVGPWSAPWDPVPAMKVFDLEGRWLGDVNVPEGNAVSHFGEDYALAAWQDELEVSFVRRFQLKRAE